MIEGIKVQLSTGELKDHLTERAEHHRQKTDFYAGQVAALVANGEESQAATLDPIKALEKRAEVHRARADYFQTLADHLIEGETYRLADSDLTRIELISQGL